MIPETHYARHDGLHIAYQVFGEGPPDILFLDQWFGHLERNGTSLRSPSSASAWRRSAG